MKQQLIIINCPNCGAEYLPAEVFLPFNYFNKPFFIKKDENGKILNQLDGELNLYETYICDHCNKGFEIRSKIIFDTKVIEEEDFSEDFCVKI
jgi:hypothetical protein